MFDNVWFANASSQAVCSIDNRVHSSEVNRLVKTLGGSWGG